MDRVLAQFEDVREVATATPGALAWQARDGASGREVLVKRLPESAGGKTRATQALALAHPHIVPTRRWLRDGGHLYVVRDFAPGHNLRQALGDTARRAFDRLQALFHPLIDALDYAHRAGLPHGGVTPENVLVGPSGETLLSDFATIENPNGVHQKYVPRHLLTADGRPTSRADLYALCELYKEFLPTRPADDEAGTAARARLLRNLTETQQTAGNLDELRYKLDAVARMAELLGFSSGTAYAETPRGFDGPRLVCTVTPPTSTLNPGGAAAIALTLGNDGDLPLTIDGVTSDAVWLNLPTRLEPFSLLPDARRELVWTLSGARLLPGSYTATLTVRSNSGLLTPRPSEGQAWHMQTVAVPTRVLGSLGDAPAADPAPPGPPPLAEDLPGFAPDKTMAFPIHSLTPPTGEEHPGIAVTQEPDPGLARAGQNGVLHLGVKNIGPQRLRLDRVTTSPSWLTYPGTFQSLWIEPGATQYLGFSIVAGNLPGGDYKAEVMFVSSITTETLLGPTPVWREMKCDVRVRVIRGGPAAPGDLKKAGCAPVLLALASSLGLLGAWLIMVH
ncbi:MAG: hypothetical protein M3Y28_00760 [Armatimonadota bacterium]|nr:hypothetical protein [Armatimonadota bacterium]